MNALAENPLTLVTYRRQVAPERLTRAFWGVMFCFLVHGLVVSTWVARIASVKGTLHLRDGALGLALLGSAIGSVLAIPICGAFVARRGTRTAASWTSVWFSLSLIPLVLAWNAWTLFAALFFYGAMAGAHDVAINSQAVVTEKLLVYALGRGVEYQDMPLVRSISHDARRGGNHFSALVLGVVNSKPFQMNMKVPERAVPSHTAAGDKSRGAGVR